MTLFEPDVVLQKITQGYEFKQAELSRLKLESANIDDAKFIDCYMRGATFIETSCCQTNFKGTNLAFANLEKTTWQNVTLDNCNVDGAVFSDAQGLSDKQKQWLKKHGALNVT